MLDSESLKYQYIILCTYIILCGLTMENRTTIQVSEDLRKQLRVLASERDMSYQELLEDMVSVFKEMDNDMTVISIPKKLADRLEEKIERTDFKNVSEYVAFILRLMLYEEALKTDVDEQRIKQRLKELGYI